MAAEACGTWCSGRGFHTRWFYMGLVAQPLTCGVCTCFLIFLETQRKGLGLVYRNDAVRGSVVNSSSTPPSSGLSTQGSLFSSCGSPGHEGQKPVSLGKEGVTQMDFVRNGLKNPPQSPATKPQNVPRSTHLSPTPLLLYQNFLLLEDLTF